MLSNTDKNSRTSFVNNEFLPHQNCMVHIEDRGFQFADGAYEVILFKNNKLIDVDAHLERLDNSLSALKIINNFSKEFLIDIAIKLFKDNNLKEGTIYLQITRGCAPRFLSVPKNIQPTIVATVSPLKESDETEFNNGYSAIIEPDLRWHRCNLKTTSLIASSLVNQKAKDMGFDDAIMFRGELDITEASYANVFIVDNDNNLITRQADNLILCGITRNRMIELAKINNIKVQERLFKIKDLLQAKEIFLTSSSLIIRPVTKVNYQNIDHQISNGQVGDIARKLRQYYQDFINS
ncbi:MAG: aminotransferase class IV [Rickettsiales bacterium]|nr:aminotransferase class IV [Rickettsiales bacterium]